MMGSMANHLWQSTIFAAVAALLALALRRERARVRYWVWLAASLKFLIPLGALIALGSHINWRPAVAATSPVLTLIQSVSQPYAQTQLSLIWGAGPEVVGSSMARTLSAILVGTWLAGFAVYLFIWLTRWRRLAAIVHRASHRESGRELDSLRRLEKALGITHRVPLLASSDALEPGVFGVVKPVLLWPVHIGTRLDEGQVEAIVAHEVCHIRYRDNLIASVHMMVEAIFWFHPLVWWIGARLIHERERACDEEVIELGNAPHVYAQGILKTCELCMESPLMCAAGVTGSDLRRRIVEIMTGEMRRNLSVSRKVLLGIAATLAILVPVASGMLVSPRLQARQSAQQSTAERPSFEVASVKVNKTGDGRMMIMNQPGGGLAVTNMPLAALIRFAYQLQDFQIIGAPEWIANDHFDIVAKPSVDRPATPPAGPPGLATRLMLQSLLADRFKLAAHSDTRQLPMYALVLARTDGKVGPQLHPSTTDCDAVMAAGRGRGGPPAPPAPGERPTCGMFMGLSTLKSGSTPISQMIMPLSQMVRRVVVDRTGLNGRFDIDLTWTPDQMPSGPPPPGAPPLPAIDPNGPSIFTALQEQLGLKLESQTGPVDVLVIDHVEQPTPD